MKIKRLLIKSVLALILFVFLTNVFVYLSSVDYIFENPEQVKSRSVVMIPGAAVFSDGTLSTFLKARVDRAIELYEQKKVSKILVSGDNSTVSHNEVSPVRKYLLARGVPEANIHLDHAGFDTYSSMYRAREVFKVSSLIIVSQYFHLPRAVYIGRALDMDVQGLSTNEKSITTSNYIREIFANVKAVVNVTFNRQPKFLGEAIPIE